MLHGISFALPGISWVEVPPRPFPSGRIPSGIRLVIAEESTMKDRNIWENHGKSTNIRRSK